MGAQEEDGEETKRGTWERNEGKVLLVFRRKETHKALWYRGRGGGLGGAKSLAPHQKNRDEKIPGELCWINPQGWGTQETIIQ